MEFSYSFSDGIPKFSDLYTKKMKDLLLVCGAIETLQRLALNILNIIF